MREHLTEKNFDAAINAPRPVLVDFWASWCGPCRAIAEDIEQLEQKFNGKADVYKVNVDEEMALAKRYRVMSIPCVIIFQNGQEAIRLLGARDISEYAEAIEEVLG